VSFQSQPQLINQQPEDEGLLRCEVVPGRNAARVRPIGSLDMATVHVLEQRLEELREAGFQRLIVDLSGLTFMDSTGLRFALKWYAASQQDGFQIGFAPGPPVVQRVFELTGMSEQVPFIRS
jgi:anti-sigma B factor antagonist